MRARFSRTHFVPLIAALLLLLGGVGAFYERDITSALTAYAEQKEFDANPTAAKAYEIAMRHFNSNMPRVYDLNRAAYFLQIALVNDPSYPAVHEQLARIQFLRARFPSALVLIDSEIALQGDKSPSAYYIRGLVRGFSGTYTDAARDFEHYIKLRPDVWAGYNDLAWVLMKSGDYTKAVEVLSDGLSRFPDNAWLLNSYAIALYETGDTEGAKDAALRARDAVQKLTAADWSKANPGNDPAIAGEGLETFRAATLHNLDAIIANQTPSQDLVR